MNSSKNNFYFVLGLILIAAFARIIPHYPNFTPLCAIALFGGKYFNNKYLAYLLPLLALWFSDILINNLVLGNNFKFSLIENKFSKLILKGLSYIKISSNILIQKLFFILRQ